MTGASSVPLALGLAVLLSVTVPGGLPDAGLPGVGAPVVAAGPPLMAADAVANFTAAVQRLVELVGFAGSGLLTLVWVRVALSWFSNDLAKKIQAKDRARDALIGTLIFTAALSGLVWGLAHWVFTGA